MTFKDISFTFGLKSSHNYSFFTFKTKGRNVVIKFKDLSHTTLSWIAKFDNEEFVGYIDVGQRRGLALLHLKSF